MAEITFNREAGAAPAGITRFRQFRTSDGSNVTVNSFRTFAGDGLYCAYFTDFLPNQVKQRHCKSFAHSFF